jgi:hypothetical protein
VVASMRKGTASWRSSTLRVPVGSNIKIDAPAGEDGFFSTPRGTTNTAPLLRTLTADRPVGVLVESATASPASVTTAFYQLGPATCKPDLTP